MLPYPSGALHMGHVRNYAIGDALARYMWMSGHNVLHPMGWDSFGLPAENAAIKHQRQPREWTLHNIAAMKTQMKRLGFSYDWSREIATCLPEYYRWNQWFFLKLFEKGLAYRKKSKVNWCSQCATVLANEQVVDGCCWRHEDTLVEQRELEQWAVRITDYSEELLQGLDSMDGWPEKVRTMQRNWIGRSEGANVDFTLDGGSQTRITVFTTRIDTIYGASSVQLAPQHPLVAELVGSDSAKLASLEQMLADQKKAREAGDIGLVVKKGFFTGHYAINPFNQERVPIWVANYILMDYGTGAIMSVPAHDERDFEFAKQYGIDVRIVILPRRNHEPPEAGQPEAPAAALCRRGFAAHQLRPLQRTRLRRGAEEDGRIRRAERLRQGHHHLSPQGLGHLAPALLGHAHPHHLLRKVRPGSRAGGSASRAPAGERRDHPRRWLAAHPRQGILRSAVSQVRRHRPPRVRHHGHLRRFQLVFLPLHQPHRHRALRSRNRQLLVPHGSVHRRRRARHSAPDVLALLDQVHARHRPGQQRRARATALHPGHGHQERRQDVQVARQRGLAR